VLFRSVHVGGDAGEILGQGRQLHRGHGPAAFQRLEHEGVADLRAEHVGEL
jgi:hypothetical protein